MYFVGVLVNDYSINEDLISSFSWHGHEMVFGFTSALITGFLLTASAKWTGKKTFSTPELVVSILIWITSRLVLLFQPSETLILVLGPLPFIYILYKMIFILKGQKNLIPVTGVISIFLGSNYLHLHSSINSDQDLVDMSYKIASIAIFVLLYIFSGKLITFFTNNKFKNKLINLMPLENILVLLICVLTILFNIFSLSNLERIFSLICSILLLRRSYKLVHIESIKDPMLLILNLGHLFFPIYFLLRFLQYFNEQAVVGRADLHSLFAGGLGLIALGMITRVSLGHTGRKIVANKWMIFAFASTFIGSILRVFHPIYLGDAINFWLHTSMGFWTLGFIIYLFNFTGLLFKPRL
jgi:uncharacterized protein involved in response to NO